MVRGRFHAKRVNVRQLLEDLLETTDIKIMPEAKNGRWLPVLRDGKYTIMIYESGEFALWGADSVEDARQYLERFARVVAAYSDY